MTTDMDDYVSPPDSSPEEGAFSPRDPSLLPTLDQLGLGDRSDKTRRRIAERAKRDLYFMCKVVLGYDALTPHTHGALCRFLDQARVSRRMILMPRTHFKTTIATIADTIRMICCDPDIRVLIISDTATNAKLFMQEISNHFKHNEVFRWAFRELIPENFNKARWNDEELQVPRKAMWREPTVTAIGAGGGVESRHFDVIKADDLVTEKHIHSDTEMDKLTRWAGGLEPLLVHDGKQMDFIGSRKKKGDTYEWVIKYYGDERPPRKIGPHAEMRGSLAVFSRSIIESGALIFPERVSMAYVTRMRTHDPERYHAQLANSPKGTGLNIFDLGWIQYYTLSPEGIIECWRGGELIHTTSVWAMERIVLYDPSVAEKKTSSQQAIIVIAKGSHPFRFVLETKIGHFAPDEAIDTLFEFDRRWMPTFHSIERRGYQGSVKYWIHERAERDSMPYLQVVEWPAEGSPKAQWSKTEHIRALQPSMRAGLWWLRPEQKELLDQIEFYPNVRWDDGLDALAQSNDYWPMMEDSESREQKEKAETRHLERMASATKPIDRGFRAAALEAIALRENWDERAFLRTLNRGGYSTRRSRRGTRRY